jgi:RES domain-containing protein
LNLPFIHLTNTVYRGHHPGWSFDPASGDGAKHHGGRFNPKGIAALYTSLRPETAWLEAQQGFAFKAQPLTLCGYTADCSGILDLTDPETRQSVDTDVSDLGCPWEDMNDHGVVPPSWELAERLISAGSAGIIVPSFASGATVRDVNVVFWNWSDARPHQVRVIDDEGRLPADDNAL